MFHKNERLRTILIVIAAVLLAALFLWSLTRDVGAQGVCDSPCEGFCDELDASSPAGAPWRLERSRDEGELCWCECCDTSGDLSWQAWLPNPGVEPTETPTATRRPPTAVPTATRTRVRATSTATMTPIPPTETAIAVTETPEPTFTRVLTPIATATFSPTDPVPPTATAVVASTATATPIPAPATETAGPTVKPITTEIPGARIAAAPDPGRGCIPTHGAAPVRLCPTGSGSGWWIYDARTGQVLQDADGRLAHVPFAERLPAGEAQALFASKRLVAVWMGNHVVVSTRYEDGKAYVFSVLEGGRVVHWQW